MEFERKIRKIGKNSLSLIIPSDVTKYFELQPNNEIILKIETGKNGKYISFWKKNQVIDNENSTTTKQTKIY